MRVEVAVVQQQGHEAVDPLDDVRHAELVGHRYSADVCVVHSHVVHEDVGQVQQLFEGAAQRGRVYWVGQSRSDGGLLFYRCKGRGVSCHYPVVRPTIAVYEVCVRNGLR